MTPLPVLSPYSLNPLGLASSQARAIDEASHLLPLPPGEALEGALIPAPSVATAAAVAAAMAVVEATAVEEGTSEKAGRPK